MEIKSTENLELEGVKLLVYGASGVGKTRLIETAPLPFIISSEGGLLSLAGRSIPYADVSSTRDLREVYSWLTSSREVRDFETICLDSLSDIAEIILDEELDQNADGRAAYGNLNIKMTKIIRLFRNLSGKNVYITAKLDKIQDEQGKIIFGPSMPGKTLTQNMPYFFDEVFALRMEKNPNNDNDEIKRALMTSSDGRWSAKDRSGKLDRWESPDLSKIINKINQKG